MIQKRRRAICWLAAIAMVGAVSANAQEAFKIGAPISSSGRYATYGTQAKNGVETAIEVWRKLRGDRVAGRPIEVFLRDTQSNNAITVSLMNAFVQTDKVHVIIGGDGSNVAAAAVAPWRRLEDRPVWIMPGGSTDVIEKEIGPDPYFFHTYPWSYHYHDNLVNALKALGTNKKVAILYSDGAYGRSHIEDAQKYLKEAGFDIVATELVREGAADFSPALTRLRAVRPNILYVLVQTNDAVQLTKQIQAKRLNVPYLVGTGQVQFPEWQEAVGAAQVCWTGITTWVPGLSYTADKKEPLLFPSAANWEKMWFEKYRAAPEFMDLGYYVSTMLALLAVEETNSTDRDRIKEWLEKQQYQTPLGYSSFKKTREALHQAFETMVVFQRQKKPDGSIASVLVYPEQVATGKLESCTD